MLKCRKCGGPHITIKCGKIEKQVIIEKTENKNNYEENNFQKNYKRKKTFTIKISNLPEGMKDLEMIELTHDWGHIHNVKVLNYDDISVAYIDFEYLEEANYFIKALDKTPFEYMILDVKLV